MLWKPLPCPTRVSSLPCLGGLARAWWIAEGSFQVRGTLVTVAGEQSSGARRAACLLSGVTLERPTCRVTTSWLLPQTEHRHVRISCRADTWGACAGQEGTRIKDCGWPVLAERWHPQMPARALSTGHSRVGWVTLRTAVGLEAPGGRAV